MIYIKTIQRERCQNFFFPSFNLNYNLKNKDSIKIGSKVSKFKIVMTHQKNF